MIAAQGVARVALVAALLVFTLSLVLVITSGAGLSQPVNLIMGLGLMGAYILLFLGQDSERSNAELFLWGSAGIWGAAAYLDFQMIGFLYLIIAVLTGASAFLVERERGGFALNGPLLFVTAALVLVIAVNAVGR